MKNFDRYIALWKQINADSFDVNDEDTDVLLNEANLIWAKLTEKELNRFKNFSAHLNYRFSKIMEKNE